MGYNRQTMNMAETDISLERASSILGTDEVLSRLLPIHQALEQENSSENQPLLLTIDKVISALLRFESTGDLRSIQIEEWKQPLSEIAPYPHISSIIEATHTALEEVSPDNLINDFNDLEISDLDTLTIYLQQLLQMQVPLPDVEQEQYLAEIVDVGKLARFLVEDQLGYTPKELERIEELRSKYADLIEEFSLEDWKLVYQESLIARGHLTQANSRFVINRAKRIMGWGMPMEDRIQEGNVGLMKAVNKFNFEKGRFSTYAAWWIDSTIKRALTQKNDPIRLSVKSGRDIDLLSQAYRDLLQEFATEKVGKKPTYADLAKATGFSVRYVRALARAMRERIPLELDRPMGNGDSTLGEMTTDPRSNTTRPLQPPDIDQLKQDVRNRFMDMINNGRILERDYQIIARRLGLEGEPETLAEIGQSYGLKKQRIKQIEVQVLRRFRFENPDLEDYF